MALPEKLYALRKKSGLSQEQLAEALNVSRQAISKWEGGSAMPESDKLLALSNYFDVSLDCLLKDGAPNAALIVYGVLSILVPSVPAQISASTAVAFFCCSASRPLPRARRCCSKAPNTNKEVSP